MPTVLVSLETDSNPSNEIGQKKSQEYKVNLSEILYDGLERQGLVLPHGCLAGSCGSCRIHVVKGIENLSPMSAVEADTVSHIKDSHPGKTVRLSCRAKVLGNVEISKL